MEVVGSNALAATDDKVVVEQELGREVSQVERKALSLKIETDADYSFAAEDTKTVKQMQKKVEEYWEPMRQSTHKAYNDVLAHKKEMLDPLKRAEQILKGKMSEYHRKVEQKRREQERAMQLLAQQEAERKLNEAAAAEIKGDAAGMEAALMEAEIYEGAAISTNIPKQTPKVQGVSTTKAWKITAVDNAQVPCFVNGMEIRPVDMAAVMRLIKASKGTIQIPGIQYEETVAVSVRS